MDLKPVKSSNIEAVGYDPATRKLQVKFKSGGVHEYDDVPAHRHAALVAHASPGGFIHSDIKNNHTCRKL